MPTYDYECTECHERFEVFQSINAKPLKRLDQGCKRCGKRAPVRRLIGTGAAVLFKGSGFYETDYRSESYKKGAEAESKSSTETKTATDTKPAGDAKTETKTPSDSTATSAAAKDEGSALTKKSEAAPKAKKSSAKRKSAR